MCISGLGPTQIAKKLKAEQVPTPTEYWRSIGKKCGPGTGWPFNWCSHTVAEILDRQEYVGDTVNLRSFSQSFKQKKRLDKPQKEWKIFPDTHPATIAHEMSHQRMVASELEANFVGIAACTSCDDMVFQYSGYLMGLIHLCNALYPVDDAAWYAIAEEYFNRELSVDWRDNSEYWSALESPVEDKAQDIYDGFLKGNDQELGIRSYGACVDLLVNYFGPQL